MKNRARLALAAVLTLGAVGCKYDPYDVSYSNIRGGLAPELSATSATKLQGQGEMAYMSNTNLRGMWDDVKRAWYLDHPSRLSPYPIISASGEPR